MIQDSQESQIALKATKTAQIVQQCPPKEEVLVSTIATELVQSLDIKTITEEASPQSALGERGAQEAISSVNVNKNDGEDISEEEQGMPSHNQIHSSTTQIAQIGGNKCADLVQKADKRSETQQLFEQTQQEKDLNEVLQTENMPIDNEQLQKKSVVKGTVNCSSHLAAARPQSIVKEQKRNSNQMIQPSLATNQSQHKSQFNSHYNQLQGIQRSMNRIDKFLRPASVLAGERKVQNTRGSTRQTSSSTTPVTQASKFGGTPSGLIQNQASNFGGIANQAIYGLQGTSTAQSNTTNTNTAIMTSNMTNLPKQMKKDTILVDQPRQKRATTGKKQTKTTTSVDKVKSIRKVKPEPIENQASFMSQNMPLQRGDRQISPSKDYRNGAQKNQSTCLILHDQTSAPPILSQSAHKDASYQHFEDKEGNKEKKTQQRHQDKNQQSPLKSERIYNNELGQSKSQRKMQVVSAKIGQASRAKSRDKEYSKSQQEEKVNPKKQTEPGVYGQKRVNATSKQPKKADSDNRSSFNTAKNPKVNLENQAKRSVPLTNACKTNSFKLSRPDTSAKRFMTQNSLKSGKTTIQNHSVPKKTQKSKDNKAAINTKSIKTNNRGGSKNGEIIVGGKSKSNKNDSQIEDLTKDEAIFIGNLNHSEEVHLCRERLEHLINDFDFSIFAQQDQSIPNQEDFSAQQPEQASQAQQQQQSSIRVNEDLEPYQVFQRFCVLLISVHGQIQSGMDKMSNLDCQKQCNSPEILAEATAFLRQLNTFEAITNLCDAINARKFQIQHLDNLFRDPSECTASTFDQLPRLQHFINTAIEFARALHRADERRGSIKSDIDLHMSEKLAIYKDQQLRTPRLQKGTNQMMANADLTATNHDFSAKIKAQNPNKTVAKGSNFKILASSENKDYPNQMRKQLSKSTLATQSSPTKQRNKILSKETGVNKGSPRNVVPGGVTKSPLRERKSMSFMNPTEAQKAKVVDSRPTTTASATTTNLAKSFSKTSSAFATQAVDKSSSNAASRSRTKSTLVKQKTMQHSTNKKRSQLDLDQEMEVEQEQDSANGGSADSAAKVRVRQKLDKLIQVGLQVGSARKKMTKTVTNNEGRDVKSQFVGGNNEYSRQTTKQGENNAQNRHTFSAPKRKIVSPGKAGGSRYNKSPHGGIYSHQAAPSSGSQFFSTYSQIPSKNAEKMTSSFKLSSQKKNTMMGQSSSRTRLSSASKSKKMSDSRQTADNLKSQHKVQKSMFNTHAGGIIAGHQGTMMAQSGSGIFVTNQGSNKNTPRSKNVPPTKTTTTTSTTPFNFQHSSNSNNCRSKLSPKRTHAKSPTATRRKDKVIYKCTSMDEAFPLIDYANRFFRDQNLDDSDFQEDQYSCFEVLKMPATIDEAFLLQRKFEEDAESRWGNWGAAEGGADEECEDGDTMEGSAGYINGQTNAAQLIEDPTGGASGGNYPLGHNHQRQLIHKQRSVTNDYEKRIILLEKAIMSNRQEVGRMGGKEYLPSNERQQMIDEGYFGSGQDNQSRKPEADDLLQRSEQNMKRIGQLEKMHSDILAQSPSQLAQQILGDQSQVNFKMIQQIRQLGQQRRISVQNFENVATPGHAPARSDSIEIKHFPNQQIESDAIEMRSPPKETQNGAGTLSIFREKNEEDLTDEKDQKA